MTQEAYSHECSSCGWWPGDPTFGEPAFFAYTWPAPPGLEQAAVRPEAAVYNADMGLFVLQYDDVRRSASPRQTLLDFCQSTYEAGATLAGWPRAELERHARAAR